jgi:hypothetical protein
MKPKKLTTVPQDYDTYGTYSAKQNHDLKNEFNLKAGFYDFGSQIVYLWDPPKEVPEDTLDPEKEITILRGSRKEEFIVQFGVDKAGVIYDCSHILSRKKENPCVKLAKEPSQAGIPNQEVVTSNPPPKTTVTSEIQEPEKLKEAKSRKRVAQQQPEEMHSPEKKSKVQEINQDHPREIS